MARTTITAEEFFNRFPAAEQIGTARGHWMDRDRVDGRELAHTYYDNDAGEVGEAESDRRTTKETYFLIWGEDADILKSYYPRKAG